VTACLCFPFPRALAREPTDARCQNTISIEDANAGIGAAKPSLRPNSAPSTARCSR
jgi:hypothetical protein